MARLGVVVGTGTGTSQFGSEHHSALLVMVVVDGVDVIVVGGGRCDAGGYGKVVPVVTRVLLLQ